MPCWSDSYQIRPIRVLYLSWIAAVDRLTMMEWKPVLHTENYIQMSKFICLNLDLNSLGWILLCGRSASFMQKFWTSSYHIKSHTIIKCGKLIYFIIIILFPGLEMSALVGRFISPSTLTLVRQDSLSFFCFCMFKQLMQPYMHNGNIVQSLSKEDYSVY